MPRDAEGFGRRLRQTLLGAGAERLLRLAGKIRRGKRMPSADTLLGRRIVVTRAPEQSDELLDRLRDAARKCTSPADGAFSRPEDTAALDQALCGSPNSTGWCSPARTRCDFFLARCRELGCDRCNAVPRPLPRSPQWARRRSAATREGLRVGSCRRSDSSQRLREFAAALRCAGQARDFCCRGATAPTASLAGAARSWRRRHGSGCVPDVRA